MLQPEEQGSTTQWLPCSVGIISRSGSPECVEPISTMSGAVCPQSSFSTPDVTLLAFLDSRRLFNNAFFCSAGMFAYHSLALCLLSSFGSMTCACSFGSVQEQLFSPYFNTSLFVSFFKTEPEPDAQGSWSRIFVPFSNLHKGSRSPGAHDAGEYR